MKLSLVLLPSFALYLAVSPCASADEPAQQAALPWRQGRAYHVGDLVNFEGSAYKALAGATHRHPDPNSEQGWRILNECGDKDPKAIRCIATSAQTKVSSEELTKDNYSQMQDNMIRNAPPPSRGGS